VKRALFPCLVWLALTGPIASPAGADEAPRPAGELLHQELVPRYPPAAIVERLRSGGYVLLMRHMETERSPDDWSGVDYENCATQRELSERGREQARTLGLAFRALGIPVGRIEVSPYCRCRETAELAFGRAGTPSELLSTWDTLSVEEKTEQGARIRRLLDTPPAPGTNTVLVTHTGNLMWSLGLDAKPEGLVHVFGPTGLDIARPDYLGRVDPDAWRTLAGLPGSDANAASDASAAPDASGAGRP